MAKKCKTKQIEDIDISKVANGYIVRTCYLDAKGNYFKSRDPSWIFTTTEEVLDKVDELLHGCK